MLALFVKLWQIICYITNQYLNDNCSGTAASLAYSTLLSIVPMMLVAISIASKIPQFMQVVHNVEHFLLRNFVAGTAGTIEQYLDEFLRQVNKLSWTSIVAFTVTAILLLYNMVHAFNLIWGVEMIWKRGFTLRFIFYFGILLMTPLLLAILMLLISYVMSLSFVSNKDFHSIVAYPLLRALPYIAAFITFSFFNWVLPTCSVKLKYACIAGFVTACFFELLKYFFTLYINMFPTYRLIYGALATIPIFIVWIYLTWLQILLGGILCKGLQDNFNSEKKHTATL
jgi:membrane protein